MWSARIKECLGMMMIGDGLLALAEPRRHCMLWQAGPGFWERMLKPFIEHPRMTRALGLAELVAGFWLASRQEPDPPRQMLSRVRNGVHRMRREMAGVH